MAGAAVLAPAKAFAEAEDASTQLKVAMMGAGGVVAPEFAKVSEMAAKFGAAAEECPILYGGSCKPSNAAEIFAKEDVDGGLIGGASLDPDKFLQIIHTANQD